MARGLSGVIVTRAMENERRPEAAFFFEVGLSGREMERMHCATDSPPEDTISALTLQGNLSAK